MKTTSMEEQLPTPNGYYIRYEDTDSRVLPYCPDPTAPFQTDKEAPFATELEATQALLSYFKNLRDELDGCVDDTEKSLRRLQA